MYLIVSCSLKILNISVTENNVANGAQLKNGRTVHGMYIAVAQFGKKRNLKYGYIKIENLSNIFS